MAVSGIALGVGLVSHIVDLAVAGAVILVAAAMTFLAIDAIVLDGRRNLVCRRQGIWPMVEEVSRPFTEIDHVFIEDMPKVESDGREVLVTRLSLVRKMGTPIVLANAYESNGSLRADAEQVARLLGVESRDSEMEVCGVSVR